MKDFSQVGGLEEGSGRKELYGRNGQRQLDFGRSYQFQKQEVR